MTDEKMWRYVHGEATSSQAPMPPAFPSASAPAWLLPPAAILDPVRVVSVRARTAVEPTRLELLMAPTWWIGFWLLHVELAGARALLWWREIGCSAHSLPALHMQAVCCFDLVGIEALLLLLLVVASLWMLERRHRRSS